MPLGPDPVRRRVALAGALALLLAACGEAADPRPAQEADSAGMLERIAAPAEAGAGTVHLVRLVARGRRYAFEPAEVHLRPGDVVRFVLTGAQPESVAFDTAGVPAAGVEFLRDGHLLRGPLLTRPGQVYEVSFHGAPAGRYPFRSLPHGELGMQGVVVVQ